MDAPYGLQIPCNRVRDLPPLGSADTDTVEPGDIGILQGLDIFLHLVIGPDVVVSPPGAENTASD
jgi:hypothetical protein